MSEATPLNVLIAVLRVTPEFDLAETWTRNQEAIKSLSATDLATLIAEKDRIKAGFARDWVPKAPDDGWTDCWYRGAE